MAKDKSEKYDESKKFVDDGKGIELSFPSKSGDEAEPSKKEASITVKVREAYMKQAMSDKK